MPICIAILAKGTQCTKNAPGLNERCGVHNNSLNSYGPNTVARNEMKYAQKKDIVDMEIAFNQVDRVRTAEEIRLHRLDVSIRKAEHRRAIAELAAQQRQQILLTGVDPDAAARERHQQRRQRLDEWRQVARDRVLDARRLLQRALGNDNQDDLINRINQVANGDIQVRGLAAFVADPQNVHTVEAVQQTKKIVDMIRKVPVPEEYRWNREIASKTPFEIGIDCRLSQRAAWQMMSQYAQNTAIYDIEEGIYGKVLDCVWQYMKHSPDKEDLCRIMKRELEDNIGMCAQGNLSRICNVLAGYMEGVGSQESLSELLGRLLPPLMEIEDNYQRIYEACVILRDNKVHPDQWDTWMQPLFDEESTELYELLKEQLAV